MSNLFHSFFDSFRVKNETPTIVHIGRNAIGSIELYPSETNPFMEEYGYVRVYDNGELFCDEHLASFSHIPTYIVSSWNSVLICGRKKQIRRFILIVSF